MAKGSRGGKRNSLFGGQSQDHRNNSTPDLPAKMNKLYNGNEMSLSHTQEVFMNKHQNSKTEHAIMYDDDGFVSTYVHGNSGSVGFTASQVEGKNMIHNHPSGGWSNFSQADLESFSTTGMKSLTATSSKATYTIKKGNKFDSAGFVKAINSAKTTETDYDKAVDSFLKRNASKYGYSYSAS